MSEQTKMKKEMQDASKKILAIKVKELVDEYTSLFPYPEIIGFNITRNEIAGFGESSIKLTNVSVSIIEMTTIEGC